MAKAAWLALLLACGGMVVGARLTGAPEERPAPSGKAAPEPTVTEYTGRTQPAPGKSALFAPTVQDSVEEVLVTVGARVKKGQVLVRIAKDQAEADVRAKQAALEVATVCAKECEESLANLTQLHDKGAIADRSYRQAKTAVARCKADERAAQAALDAAKVALDGYQVTAPIDGIVAALDVVPGQVSRPGRAVWGQILDLSEIDVRCDLPPAEVDRLALGQTAEVTLVGNAEVKVQGKIVTIGIAADPKSGKVPVLVRLDNRAGKLRCYVEVKVRFPSGINPAAKS